MERQARSGTPNYQYQPLDWPMDRKVGNLSDKCLGHGPSSSPSVGRRIARLGTTSLLGLILQALLLGSDPARQE